MSDYARASTHRASAPARATTLLAILAVLGLTATWGSTYFMIKDLIVRVPTMDFLALRFAIAALALFLVAPATVFRLPRRALAQAVVLGLLYAAGMVAQTVGLEHTSASVSGFITGLYVVITPLLAAAVFRTHVPLTTWVAATVAVAGVAVLTLNGFSVGIGEAVTLAGACVFALHILGLSRWSQPKDAIAMTTVQVAVIALVCTPFALRDGLTLPDRGGDWAALLYMALVVGAAGLLAQTWAQAHLSAPKTAIIMSVEPVFASGFAVAFGGETLTSRLIFGGVLVVLAMLLSELTPGRHPEGEVPHIAV